MKRIISPTLVTTPLRQIDSGAVKREVLLMVRKHTRGLNANETQELQALIRHSEAKEAAWLEAQTQEATDGLPLTESDVDKLAERYSEGQRSRYHDLPIARNFYE